MQTIKKCVICGNEFVSTRKDTVYCSKVCYYAGIRRQTKRRNAEVREKIKKMIQENDEFDLEAGDIIIGPDKWLDEKGLVYRFVVTKIYPHIFEAMRLDKGYKRTFSKADYICKEVRRDN